MGIRGGRDLINLLPSTPFLSAGCAAGLCYVGSM